MKKTCSKCGQEKDLENFAKDKRSPSGRSSWCKACQSAKSKEWRAVPENRSAKAIVDKIWREKNLESVRASNTEWNKANPGYGAAKSKEWRTIPENKERQRAASAAWLKSTAGKTSRVKKYGITGEDYQQMLVEQGFVCKTCGKPEKTGKALAVDHDHKTGKVRGLLCGNCNQALGLLNDDLGVVKKLLVYLKRA
jgi:hypothetical protein